VDGRAGDRCGEDAKDRERKDDGQSSKDKVVKRRRERRVLIDPWNPAPLADMIFRTPDIFVVAAEDGVTTR